MTLIIQQHPAPIPPPLPATHAAVPTAGVSGVVTVGAVGTVSVSGVSGVNTVSGVNVNGNGVAPPALPQAQLRRLLAAYRVGMLALETQARRVHDDRPQNKFGR